MYLNKKSESDNRSPPVDIYFNDTTSAASVTSTLASIRHRGQANIDIQQNCDSDENEQK